MKPFPRPLDSMETIAEMVGRVEGIHLEEISLPGAFEDVASRFAAEPGTVVLLSGGDLDCARYHILGIRPWLALKVRSRELVISSEKETFHCRADPFEMLRLLLERFRVEVPPGLDLPVAAGLMGYFSYELKDLIETLPRTSVDDLGLPHLCLYASSLLLIHDRRENRTRLCLPKRIHENQPVWRKSLDAFRAAMAEPPGEPGRFWGDIDGLHSGFTRPEYEDAVARIKAYIVSGHVYQVNLSQRFETAFAGDPFALFLKLYQMNPAPFFSYVHGGDHVVVSTSPERFVKLEGTKVETRPIKGTRPRGRTPEQDDAYGRALLASEKDQAELSMIVDLLRNDLGKVCRAGTVRVVEHKRLEPYQNVYHLVSIVAGERSADRDAVDLIQAAFPGGSITGCPKIRSMEIIDELEPVRRHVYTGSIGYLSFHDTLDLSIAIRTAVIVDDRIYFSVGGGIVYDSDPADEYRETLHKGRTLMDVFQDTARRHAGSGSEPEPVVWMNGTFQSASRALIPATGWGLQYGYGFFETIRADRGKPAFLTEHMARFQRTWSALFKTDPPDITWNEVVGRVLEQNRLDRRTAAVKILAALQSESRGRRDVTLLVTARPYLHRLEAESLPGLDLITYPHGRLTPLADHKTLNYLYYLLAGQWAAAQGGHEALILNPDGSLSETNTANILVVKGRQVIRPVSPHVLPGIMEDRVQTVLEKQGFRLSEEILNPEALFQADHILLTNSLMGAVPVISLDGKRLPGSSDLAKTINRIVLSGG